MRLLVQDELIEHVPTDQVRLGPPPGGVVPDPSGQWRHHAVVLVPPPCPFHDPGEDGFVLAVATVAETFPQPGDTGTGQRPLLGAVVASTAAPKR